MFFDWIGRQSVRIYVNASTLVQKCIAGIYSENGRDNSLNTKWNFCTCGAFNVFHYLMVVSKCLQAGVYLYKLLASQLERSGTQIHGLCFSAEFQARKPPIWPLFFTSNYHKYGHGQATMLQLLSTHTLRLNLCGSMLSLQLAYA